MEVNKLEAASAGVPREVIERAASVLNRMGNNQQIDRLSSAAISAQDQQYKVQDNF